MSFSGVLVLLLIAGICGAVAQAIIGWSNGGCLASVGVGLVGALLGSWIAQAANLPQILPVQVNGATIPVVWTLLGSAVFVAVLSLLFRFRRRPAHPV